MATTILRFLMTADTARGLAAIRAFEQGLRRLQMTMAQTNRQAATATTAWDRFADKMGRAGMVATGMGAALTIGLTAPLIAIAKEVVDVGSEFERQMFRVEKLVGIPPETLKTWIPILRQIGVEAGRGPVELGDALFWITSAGQRSSAALDILEKSAQGAAIGLGSTKDIAKTVTAALNAFGSEGLTAARATEILFKTVKEGNLDAAGLAKSMGQVIATAKITGASFEDIAASIASFTRLGVDVRMAAVGIRQVFVGLLRPAEQSRKALSLLGTSAAELRRRLGEEGLAPVLVDIISRFQELGPAGQESIARFIPNVRAMAAALGTAGVQAESYLGISKLMRTETDLFGEAFQRVQETVAFQLQKVGAEFDDIKLELAGALLPILKEDLIPLLHRVAGAVKAMVSAFALLPGPIREAVVALTAWAALLGPIAILLGQVGLAIAFVITPLWQMITAQKAATAATAASSLAMGAQTAALGPLAGKTLFLASTSGVVTGAVNLQRTAIQKTGKSLLDSAKAMVKNAAANITAAQATGRFALSWNALGAALGSGLLAIQKLMGSAGIGGAIARFAAWAIPIQIAVESFTALTGKMKETLDNTIPLNEQMKRFGDTWSWILVTLSAGTGFILKLIEGFAILKNILMASIAPLREFLGEIQLLESVDEIFEELQGAFEIFWHAMLEAHIEDLVQAWSDAFTGFRDTGVWALKAVGLETAELAKTLGVMDVGMAVVARTIEVKLGGAAMVLGGIGVAVGKLLSPLEDAGRILASIFPPDHANNLEDIWEKQAQLQMSAEELKKAFDAKKISIVAYRKAMKELNDNALIPANQLWEEELALLSRVSPQLERLREDLEKEKITQEEFTQTLRDLRDEALLLHLQEQAADTHKAFIQLGAGVEKLEKDLRLLEALGAKEGLTEEQLVPVVSRILGRDIDSVTELLKDQGKVLPPILEKWRGLKAVYEENKKTTGELKKEKSLLQQALDSLGKSLEKLRAEPEILTRKWELLKNEQLDVRIKAQLLGVTLEDLDLLTGKLTDSVEAEIRQLLLAAEAKIALTRATSELQQKYREFQREPEITALRIKELATMELSAAEKADWLGLSVEQLTSQFYRLDPATREVERGTFDVAKSWIAAKDDADRFREANEKLASALKGVNDEIQAFKDSPLEEARRAVQIWGDESLTTAEKLKLVGKTSKELDEIFKRLPASIEGIAVPYGLLSAEIQEFIRLKLEEIAAQQKDTELKAAAKAKLKELHTAYLSLNTQIDEAIEKFDHFKDVEKDLSRATAESYEAIKKLLEQMVIEQGVTAALTSEKGKELAARLALMEATHREQEQRKREIEMMKEVEKRVSEYRNMLPDLIFKIDLWRRAGANNNLIIEEMGDELVKAGEMARRFGIELDESTKALIRQAERMQKNRKAAEDMEKAMTTAMGNIVSSFADGVADMLFEGEKFSIDIKGIFKELGKAVVKIFVTFMFAPLLERWAKFSKNLSDSIWGVKKKGDLQLGGVGTTGGATGTAGSLLETLGAATGKQELGIIGSLLGAFGGGGGGGKAVPVFVTNWPGSMGGGSNSLLDAGKKIIDLFSGGSKGAGNAIYSTKNFSLTNPGASFFNNAASNAAGFFGGGSALGAGGFSTGAFNFPGLSGGFNLATGGFPSIAAQQAAASTYSTGAFNFNLRPQTGFNMATGKGLEKFGLDKTASTATKGASFGSRALGGLAGAGMGFGIGAAIGGTKGGIIGGAAGGVLGALFPALMTNPWTAVAALAVQGITMAIKKWWPKSAYSKTANEIGRDFGIDVGKKTIESFTAGIGMSKDVLKKMRKTTSSSPAFFKEVLLPQAQAMGQGAVDALIASFSRLEVGPEVVSAALAKNPALQSLLVGKKAGGQGLFDLSGAVRTAVESGDFAEFNRLFSDIFGTEGVQKLFPQWAEKLLAATSTASDGISKVSESADKALTALVAMMGPVREQLQDPAFGRFGAQAALSIDTVTRSLTEMQKSGELNTEEINKLTASTTEMRNTMSEQFGSAATVVVAALDAIIEKLKELMTMADAAARSGDSLRDTWGGPGRGDGAGGLMGPDMANILKQAQAQAGEVGTPYYWKRVIDLINSERNWMLKTQGGGGPSMFGPGVAGGTDTAAFDQAWKMALAKWHEAGGATGAGTAPLPPGWIEGSFGGMPQPTLQQGGFITRSGSAFLHRGEVVVPASRTRVRDSGKVEVNLNFHNNWEIHGDRRDGRQMARDEIWPEFKFMLDSNTGDIAAAITRAVERTRKGVTRTKA